MKKLNFYMSHIDCAKYLLFENPDIDISTVLVSAIHNLLGRFSEFEDYMKINYSPTIEFLILDIKDSQIINKLSKIQDLLNEKYGGLTEQSILYLKTHTNKQKLIKEFEEILKLIASSASDIKNYLQNSYELDILAEEFEKEQQEDYQQEEPVSLTDIKGSKGYSIENILEQARELSTENKKEILKEVLNTITEYQDSYKKLYEQIIQHLLNS